MLTTLLAWIYISFLSWLWGILFLQFIKKIIKSELELPHFSIICLTGLSAITVVAGTLSLFIPMGEWWVQFIFIIPCLILFFKKDSPAFFVALKKELQNLHFFSIILLTACLLLILVMSSWTIIHPDTLGYHAQTIQWIGKYKAVPGLAYLHVRFGYQWLWFVDTALFSFSFTAKVEVSFLINADGILNVKAKELRSGVEQSVEVKPQYGLTDSEVEKMLLESIEHASEDIKLRALVEAKTEAQQLIDTTQKFLGRNAEFLLPEEIAATSKAIDDLKLVLDSGNKDLINTQSEALNEISRPYAERVMDMAINKAMSGKSIKDSI